MVDKRTITILGATLLILGVAAMMRSNVADKPKLTFTESNLQVLEDKLNSLEIQDLEGLTVGNITPVQFTPDELSQLGSKIEQLSFEDLEGLSSS